MLLVVTGVLSCTEGPVVSAPEVEEALSYDLSLRAQRSVATSGAQDNALDAAFDLVNRFRVVLTRADGTVAADTVIEVTPGQDEYDLPVDVVAETPGEVFTVVITALHNELPLFTSTPTSVSAASSGEGAPPVVVEVEYSGPGVTAVSVEAGQAGIVVSPGGTGTLTATVRDGAGNEIGGVPLFWTTESTAATVQNDGVVTGESEGIATATVTTPTGLAAAVLVYVVGGEVAYVSSGHVFQGEVGSASATDRTPATTGARAPAWGPEGVRVLYVAGGDVREIGGGLRVEGAFPSVSPDGTKLAFQRGGRTFFANADGTVVTGGPDGKEAVWTGASELVVSGGSIERVDAGTGTRETLESDASARLPAVGPGGEVAFLAERGGRTTVVVGGEDVLPAELVARSRPAWSANGSWLVVSAAAAGFPATLHVLPESGGAPVALGFATTEETDPAWRPEGPGAAPPAVEVTGLNPSRPLPGQEVEVLGTGFDALIPGNNRVFFPTDAGEGEVEVEVEVRSVSTTALGVRAPEGVSTGTLRVTTFTGEGTLGVTPSTGTLRVVASTAWGKGVNGVDVRIRQGGETVATGTTNTNGTSTFTNLFTGTYQVDVTGVRDGFSAPGSLGGHEVELDATTTVVVDVDAEVRRVTVSPEAVAFEAPGEEAALSASVRDVDGDEIPTATPTWTSSNEAVLQLLVSGSDATAEAQAPGSAVVTVAAGGRSAAAEITVKGAVSGTVATTGGKGVSGGGIEAVQDGETVGTTTTNDDGDYRLTGLPLGALEIRLSGLRDGFELPEGDGGSRDVEVVEGGAEPEADFTVKALVRSMELSSTKVEIPAPGEVATLSVEATDVDGDPVPDLAVEWTSSDEAVVTLESGAAAAALVAGTSVRALGLAPGDVEVTAAADGFEARAAVSVLGGIRGSVLYDHGAAFEGATLVLSQDGSEVGRSESAVDGSFLLGGLAVGDYVLTIVLEESFSPVDGPDRDVSVLTGEGAPSVEFLVDPEARAVSLDLVQEEDEVEELQLGDRFEVNATVTDARGADIPNAEITWTSSDDDILDFEDAGDGAALFTGSIRVFVLAVGPGSAEITATADEVTSPSAAFNVQGAVRGRLVRPDGRTFAGATVHLRQDGTDVQEPILTGADGAFEFLNLAPGDYSLFVDLPTGFSLAGSNPRTVTVGPGLGFLELEVRAGIQRIVVDPEDPTVEVGETITVTATVLDRLGEPITSFDRIRWRSADDHTRASGSALTGSITGRVPTATIGGAIVNLELNGEPFPIEVTVVPSAGTRTGPVKVAGVGGNSGNTEADAAFSSGDIDGSIDRLSVSAFNAMSVSDLIATYEVLIITWASSSSLNVDWATRIKPFLEAGGGVIYEDPNNTGDLSAIFGFSGSCSGSGFMDLTASVPGLTDGVRGSTDAGTSAFSNNHFCMSTWASWLSPFIAHTDGTVTGLFGDFGAGRMVITGPDQDFHAFRGASSGSSSRNQYDLLVNEILWVSRRQ